jgi:ABC-type lipoprotein release transport system permease subunit
MRTPDPETLRNQLNIEWNDFFQTRAQSWKSLEFVSALVIGLVGVGLKIDDFWVTLALGTIVIFAAILGFLITLHHRNVQLQQNVHVTRLEKELNLDNVLKRQDYPQKYKIIDWINPFKKSTPLIIMKMHILIIIFVVIYLVKTLH